MAIWVVRIMWNGKTEAGSSLSATEWENKSQLSESPWEKSPLDSDLQFLLCNNDEARSDAFWNPFWLRYFLNQRINGFSMYVWRWVSASVPSQGLSHSHQEWVSKDFPNQGRLELCLMAWGWPYQVATKGRRTCSWKAISSAGPADRLGTCHSVLYQPHYFPSHALQRCDFPRCPATAVTESHIAVAYQECFRLEVTTMYGLRSHRQSTFCTWKSPSRRASKCFSMLFPLRCLSFMHVLLSFIYLHSLVH